MGCGKVEHLDDSNRRGNCICDVVRAIHDIQKHATDDCGDCPTNCFAEPLGGLGCHSKNNANTRVFMLLTKNGDPFKAFFRNKHHHHTPLNEDCVSVFFRVEDIFDNCCATLRVLRPLDADGKPVSLVSDADPSKIDLNRICDVKKFKESNSCVTVDLDCFCGIECIEDVFLDICD